MSEMVNIIMLVIALSYSTNCSAIRAPPASYNSEPIMMDYSLNVDC